MSSSIQGTRGDDADAIEQAHRRAVAMGQDTYLDPATGATVFTETWLLARGSCCSTGCRHCPFEPRHGTIGTTRPATS